MLTFFSSNWRSGGVGLRYQFLVRLVGLILGWWSLFTCKPWNWFSNCSISSSDSEKVLLELLEAVWMSRVFNMGSLLVEEVISSFFTSSSNFWLTISNVVLSLDLRLVCQVTGSLTKGFSKDGIGLTRFLDWEWPWLLSYLLLCLVVFLWHLNTGWCSCFVPWPFLLVYPR